MILFCSQLISWIPSCLTITSLIWHVHKFVVLWLQNQAKFISRGIRINSEKPFMKLVSMPTFTDGYHICWLVSSNILSTHLNVCNMNMVRQVLVPRLIQMHYEWRCAGQTRHGIIQMKHVECKRWNYRKYILYKTHQIPNVNDSRLVLQLSLSNPLKLGNKSRMKV